MINVPLGRNPNLHYPYLTENTIFPVFTQGLTPQNGYVWFLPSWLADSWWHVDDSSNHGHTTEGTLDVPCSTSDMQQFVSGGYFSLSNAFFGSNWDTVQGGGTVTQWRQQYEERVKKEVVVCSKRFYIPGFSIEL